MTEHEAPAERTMTRGASLLALLPTEAWFGSERANLLVVETLRDAGLPTHVLTSSWHGRGLIQPELQRRNHAWSEAPFGYHWTSRMASSEFRYLLYNLWGVAATSWHLRRQTRRLPSSVVLVPGLQAYSFVAPALLTSNVPVILRGGDELADHSSFHRRLASSLLSRANVIVVNSEFLRRRFLAAGAAPEKTVLIYNHPPRRISSSTPLDADPARQRLVFVGQITGDKGAPEFVEASLHLVARHPDLDVIIVGRGDEEERLKLRVSESGLASRIQFAGFAETVAPYFEAATIVACPSMFADPSPNVVVEAKRFGVPVVGFPRGGIPELVRHGIDGLVCADATAAALEANVSNLLSSPAQLAAFRRAALQDFDARFGEARFRRQWLDVIARTTDSHQFASTP